MKRFVAAISIGVLFACNDKHVEQQEDPLFTMMDSTGINFTNTIYNTRDFNIFNYRNFYNGGGVAVGDINNDGLADVFFTANMSSNKLFLNKGNWKFDDISTKAGIEEKEEWSTGVVMVDINHDNWLDIFVCNAGYISGRAPECKLFINNHDLTFTDSAAAYGLTNKGGYTTHAAFFDYDLDGDLDCFIINNSFIPVNTLNYANKRNLRAPNWPVADFLKGGGDHLLRNDDGKFVDVSEDAGIYGSLISFGLGVTVGDINGDNYPDVYVSNDFFERDYLYINQKNGTFKDELESWVQHTSLSSMGADMADVNNDGYPDIFTTDMLPDNDQRLKTTTSFENYDVYRLKETTGFYHQFTQNTLQINNGNGKFCESAYYSNVAASDWSWGGLIFDADNDGFTDLYVCNGINHDVTNQDFINFFADNVVQKMVLTGEKEDIEKVIAKMPSVPIANKTFKNDGNLKFTDIGKQWGLEKPSFSNGSAYGDLDNDGDLDLVVNNVNEPAFIYRNNSIETKKNHYIGVTLKGAGKNTMAIGSIIKVFSGNNIFTREVIPTRGFQSSVDYKNIIGLGNENSVDSLMVVWPNKTYNIYTNYKTDTTWIIQQPEHALPLKNLNKIINVMFTEITSLFTKHTENDYVDFYNERNLPEMLSKEGPKADTADVNGDRLTDVFIGGAEGQPGKMYIQKSNGSFESTNELLLKKFSDFEDVAVCFFDCDNDGDKDLFVGAGGNNKQQGMIELQHRLYINDGKGNFSMGDKHFPPNGMNISVAAPYDFDSDGDIDLFVGGRSVPLNYGADPKSYFYENDGNGHFTDITKTKAAPLQNIGMVTNAVWADIDGDNKKELIITGEWMSPRIFKYTSNSFTEIKTNLSDLMGWWQTVTVIDVNKDGKQDILLGNIGENFYLQPTKDNPVKLWINDFDQNGTVDKILTYTVDGKDKPVFMKNDLQDQLPGIKKQNLRNEDYATKSMQDLFSPEIIKRSSVKTFNYASSCVAINNGNGNFTVQKLPVNIQLSSVNVMKPFDFNSDGYEDIILAGNKLTYLPQFGRQDQNYGNVLLNNKNGSFTDVRAAQSGLSVTGQVNDMIIFKQAKDTCVLFLRNNDVPVLYKINKLH